MRPAFSIALIATALVAAPAFGANTMIPPANLTVGKNLQTFASIRLKDQAPDAGLEVTLTTDDPARLLLSLAPDAAGVKSIKLKINPHYVETPDFCIQAFGDKGTATFTASAPGFDAMKTSVKLAPSAILIAGPFKAPSFKTTPATHAKIMLYSAHLDEAKKVVAQQSLAGGMSIPVTITSSDPKIGATSDSQITFKGGEAAAGTDFAPAGVGQTTLTLKTPDGFTKATTLSSVTAIVELPGIGLTGEINLGKDLQVPSDILLGEPAPVGGLKVTLTSSDPTKLLIARNGEEVGSGSIVVDIPAGGIRGTYFLQGTGDSGAVTHSATAPGYRVRTAPITLAPSGIMVVFAPYGPPDEAEFLRHKLTRDPRPFTVSVNEKKKTQLALWPVYLDPKTLRGADITAQRLRPGVSVTVALETSDPEVGKTPQEVTMASAAEWTMVDFLPVKAGKTTISVKTPKGFTTPSNATTVTATVTE